MSEIIAFTSGKGGVGKSTICVAIAQELSEMDKKVLIIELDSGLRCIDIMLKLENEIVYDLEDVVKKRCELSQAIITSQSHKNLSIISAAYNPDFFPNNIEIYEILKATQNYDYIFFDTGAGYNDNLKSIIDYINTALIIVTPDSISVRDARRISDTLYNDGAKNLRLIINKVNIDKPNNMDDFDKIIDETATRLIGIIPKNDDIFSSTRTNENFLWQKTIKNLAFRLNNKQIELAIY